MHTENNVEVVRFPMGDLPSEIKALQAARDQLKYLKESFDSIQLAKDIRHLQEASRIQNMRPDLRDLLLKELQRRKLIKQVVDLDFN